MGVVTMAKRGSMFGWKRRIALTLAIAIVVVCIASAAAAVISRRSPASIPIQVGTSEIVIEIDRSPNCANGMLACVTKAGQALLTCLFGATVGQHLRSRWQSACLQCRWGRSRGKVGCQASMPTWSRSTEARGTGDSQ